MAENDLNVGGLEQETVAEPVTETVEEVEEVKEGDAE
jgi:hypothetical protein